MLPNAIKNSPVNMTSNNTSGFAGTKNVFFIESSETGNVSLVKKSSTPIIIVMDPFKTSSCLTTCSLDNSVDESENNSSGNSIKRLIEASWVSPSVPPPQ